MLVLRYGKYLSKQALLRYALPAVTRNYCDFSHNWKPGRYPETKEEREAAARKYNLIPEDYVPTEETRGMGDYPDIEHLSHQIDARPYGPTYDENYFRRNYGEPLSEFWVAQQLEPPDQVDRKRGPWAMAFLFGLTLLIILGIFGPEYEIIKQKPKQYPPQYFPGVRPKIHYTFEMED